MLASRAVQTYPVTRLTRRPDRNRSEIGRSDLLRWSTADFLHHKPTSADRFRFLSPKNLKTRTNWRKTHNPAKTQIPARKFQILVIKTQISAIKNPDSGAISRRSNEILIESSEISSNSVRLKPDLAKSHRFQWDFRRIWVFLTFSCGFSHLFLPFSQIFVANQPVQAPVKVWSARPIYSCSRRRMSFSKTRFCRVGFGLGTNPTRTDLWTALVGGASLEGSIT